MNTTPSLPPQPRRAKPSEAMAQTATPSRKRVLAHITPKKITFHSTVARPMATEPQAKAKA